MRLSGKEEGLLREEKEIRNRQWATRRLPFDFHPPFLLRRLLDPYGLWPNLVGRPQRVCSFISVSACLPLTRPTRRRSRRKSWLHPHVDARSFHVPLSM
jgi:hypothetical protein